MPAPAEPPVLEPPDAEIEQIRGLWWVAHCRPRQEKALARELASADVAYFLPLYEVRRTSRGRSWTARLPLFPGYLFFCGGETARLSALRTNRVVRLIPVPDQARLVSELSGIHRLIASGLGVDPYPGLSAGARCRVRSGPLQGAEGTVVRRRDKVRFVVHVTILGQGAAVEIDGGKLEALD